ncbi:MAG: hypothetical protein ACNI27_12770 [Desulfovibrio sp.]
MDTVERNLSKQYVHSGMARFVMPDHLHCFDDDGLELTSISLGGKSLAAVETLAQSGALHWRVLLDFKRHVFLLGVRSFEEDGTAPEGPIVVSVKMKGRGSKSSSYIVEGRAQGYCVRAEMSFASVEYDDHFRQEILEPRYRELFQCLKRG